MTIAFNEPVTGLTLSDLSLSLNGGANLLTSAQTLITNDDVSWTLGNLTGLDGTSGNYTLTLLPTGISDSQGHALASGATGSFTVDTVAPTASITPVTPNPSNGAVSQMTITFSKPVVGFTLADLALSLNSGPNLLTGTQTLTSSDNINWTLGNLANLTNVGGNYTLTLAANGISDAAGNTLVSGVSSSFTVDSVAPTLANPSFETPSLGSGYVYTPTGAGWTFTGSSGIQGNGSAWGIWPRPTAFKPPSCRAVAPTGKSARRLTSPRPESSFCNSMRPSAVTTRRRRHKAWACTWTARS